MKISMRRPFPTLGTRASILGKMTFLPSAPSVRLRGFTLARSSAEAMGEGTAARSGVTLTLAGLGSRHIGGVRTRAEEGAGGEHIRRGGGEEGRHEVGGDAGTRVWTIMSGRGIMAGACSTRRAECALRYTTLTCSHVMVVGGFEGRQLGGTCIDGCDV